MHRLNILLILLLFDLNDFPEYFFNLSKDALYPIKDSKAFGAGDLNIELRKAAPSRLIEFVNASIALTVLLLIFVSITAELT